MKRLKRQKGLKKWRGALQRGGVNKRVLKLRPTDYEGRVVRWWIEGLVYRDAVIIQAVDVQRGPHERAEEGDTIGVVHLSIGT